MRPFLRTHLRSSAVLDRRSVASYKTSVQAELHESRLSEIIDVLVERPRHALLAAVIFGLRSNDTLPCLLRLC